MSPAPRSRPRSRRVLPSLATAFASAWLAAAGAGASPADPDAVARGRQVYEAHCRECHGEAGKGDGKTAVKLGFKPRDMTHGAYKCRCTATGELPADDDLARSVARGLPGTPMLGYADTLDAGQIAAVVAYVKTFSARFAAAPAACLALPEPPPQTAALAARGEEVYRLLQCWTCHGASGAGDGPSAATLKDDWGQKIKPRKLSDGKFKCGGEARELYRTLHTGFNGSPMASFADAFAFTREAGAHLEAVERQLGAPAAAAVRAYLEGEPDAAAWKALTDAEREARVAERTWSLVAHVRALAAAK